jgi:DNA-directed RNA polymerase specialized sigma subunit
VGRAIKEENDMTYDETRTWLLEVRKLKKMKRYHLNEIENIKEDCRRIREGKAAVLCLAKVQKTIIHNPTEEAAIKIVDEYGDKVNYHIIEINRIDVMVHKMHVFIEEMREDNRLGHSEYEMIHYYFFEGMSNEEVAIATGYSVDSVYKIKKSAIKKVGEAVECGAMEIDKGMVG